MSAFPEAGRMVPEIGEPAIRELIIYSYRLIYEIFPDKIEVLALIHAKRNCIKDLGSEPQREN
ncbi:MAG: type II toxin-antitoxin system RelE/ParE family toxin [Chlorobium sp.]